ncbi:unnamed protein product [Brassica oleracea var. botrytis]
MSRFWIQNLSWIQSDLKYCLFRRDMQYCRKGISSVASSPMSTRVKHAWEEQDKLVLGLAFIGGWFSKALISMASEFTDGHRSSEYTDEPRSSRIEETRALIQKVSQV